jgi:hypothetical protein
MAQLDWSVISTEFAKIESVPETERAAMLAALDPEVRSEVESLLDAIGRTGGFLSLDAEPPTVGTTLGPYVLREVIGAAAWAVVYSRERHDGRLRARGGDQRWPTRGSSRRNAPAVRAGAADPGAPQSSAHRRACSTRDAGGHRYFVMELVQGHAGDAGSPAPRRGARRAASASLPTSAALFTTRISI